MDLATFYENFRLLSDAPNGVKMLREMILQLAVQGKLVPQDTNDEPASVLLEKIKAEKARLVKEGKLKKSMPLPPIEAGEVPFEVPAEWEWVRLGSMALRIGSGSTPRGGKSVYVDDGVPFLRSQNVWNSGLMLSNVALIPPSIHRKMKNTHVLPGDILLNITGASLGRCALVSSDFGEANVSQHVSIIRTVAPETRRFLHGAMRSPFVQSMVWGRQVGMAREGLSKKVLELFELPVPPRAEQHRIVAKVDELMALCDELEERQVRQVEVRGKANGAALDRLLNATDADDFAHHWQRICDHFDILYDNPDNVAELRMAILQLAVQGKLVPQDPNDEPVDSFLRRLVRADRWPNPATTKTSGREKSPDNIAGQSAIAVGDLRLREVSGWKWMPLLHHARLEAGHAPSRRHPEYWDGEVPWVGLKDARASHGGVIQATLQHTNELGLANSAARKLPAGTVCLSRTASIGYALILGAEMATSQDFINWVCCDALSPQWLLTLFLAEQGSLRRFAKGTTHKTIYFPVAKAFHVHVPPLPEQHRIVAKVDELMALCDEFENGLREGLEHREQLSVAMAATVA